MKIYVSVDMEGIAGVLLPEQLKKENWPMKRLGNS